MKTEEAKSCGSCSCRQLSRELIRVKLLARGKGEHYAYHVTSDGLVLRANVEAYYLALFTRMHNFWDLVASYLRKHGCPFAVSMDEIDGIDGKRDFTRIDSSCGETYVDAVFPCDLPYAYLATRATADEFKEAIVERKAEAAKRGNRDYDVKGDFFMGEIIAKAEIQGKGGNEEMTREDKINHAIKAFSEHIAELREYDGLQVLDWHKPGEVWYRVRYVFDRTGRRIYISGDLGEAVVWPTWDATFANTFVRVADQGKYTVNEGYFLEKVAATSNRFDYDRAEAEKVVREHCPDIDEDDLEVVMADFDDDTGFRHIGSKARRILGDIDEYCWEWYPHAGESIHGRIYLWLVGLRLAWEKLEKSEGGQAK